MAKQQQKRGFKEQIKTIGMAFSFTAKRDKWFIPLISTAILLPLLLVFAHVLFNGGSWIWIPIAVFVSLLAMMIVLNMRTSKAVTKETTGQPGAAFAVVDNMRGWHATAGIAASPQQDLIHRAVGKPGVVLLAENHGGRVRKLLNQERKKLNRLVGSTPVYEVIVGERDNEVPLGKLRRTLTKLPHNIKPKQANHLHKRLTALGTRLPMPKGPMPTSTRPPKGTYKAMKGR